MKLEPPTLCTVPTDTFAPPNVPSLYNASKRCDGECSLQSDSWCHWIPHNHFVIHPHERFGLSVASPGRATLIFPQKNVHAHHQRRFGKVAVVSPTARCSRVDNILERDDPH